MSASLPNDSSVMYSSSTPITIEPFTIVAWVNANDGFSAQRYVCGLCSDNQDFVGVGVTGGGDDAVLLLTYSGINDPTESVSSASVAGAWNHIACVYTADNDRELFLNGSSDGTDTSDRSVASHTNIYFNNPVSDGPDNTPGNALVAHAAFYDTDLSSAQIASLAAGANPLAVAPSNLVAYYPLNTDFDLTDHAGSYDLTNSGCSYNSSNPTVDAPPGGSSGIEVIGNYYRTFLGGL